MLHGAASAGISYVAGSAVEEARKNIQIKIKLSCAKHQIIIKSHKKMKSESTDRRSVFSQTQAFLSKIF